MYGTHRSVYKHGTCNHILIALLKIKLNVEYAYPLDLEEGNY